MSDRKQQEGGQGRPVSRREQATIALLEAVRTNEALSEHARETAASALSEWKAGHRACLALFESYADADARLAAIRAGLLHRLAGHAGPDATPLAGLLAMGGPSVPGWLAPLTPALRAATLPSTPTEPAPLGEVSELKDRAEIGAAMRREGNAEATSLELVECRDSGVRLQLCVPIAWHPVDGWGNEDGPQISARRMVEGRVFRAVTWRLGLEAWRAYAALVAGVWMADRVALGAVAAATVKRHLLDSLGSLLAGTAAPREAVEQFAARLEAERAPAARRRRRHGQQPRSLEFRWPAAHAVVVGAIDRFVSAVDAEPLATAPPEGTWVHVWADDGREPYGAGPVVAAPPPSGRRRGRRWLGRWWVRAAAAPAAAVPVLWVRVDGETREVPLALVQVARPASLFG